MKKLSELYFSIDHRLRDSISMNLYIHVYSINYENTITLSR